jgi:putative oxygen-independent coproporphyrinogen III oxidase
MNLPLTLYIHLPWCVRKCPYCDFNSHALRGEVPENGYVDALLADLDDEATRTQGREVHAIFFGGGTPSLFSAPAIGRILDHAAAGLSLATDCEVTLEANPGTAEAARFAGYRAAGVNRLSLGVQSFDDTMLRTLGRIHGAAEAERAMAFAREAGFERINLDLMHGLPGQSEDGAVRDIEAALAFDPGHISHYQLTLEPNTAFHRDPPELPDDDSLAAIQDACHDRLRAAGYAQYEVSAWARPGQECRHNLNYWGFGDYLGIGAGAHGKLTDTGGRVTRRWKKKHPSAWIGGATEQLDGREELDAGTLEFEFLLNTLRLRDGFTESSFHSRTGRNIDELRPKLEQARRDGLLEFQENHWRASDLGWRFLNDLQARFLP